MRENGNCIGDEYDAGSDDMIAHTSIELQTDNHIMCRKVADGACPISKSIYAGLIPYSEHRNMHFDNFVVFRRFRNEYFCILARFYRCRPLFGWLFGLCEQATGSGSPKGQRLSRNGYTIRNSEENHGKNAIKRRRMIWSMVAHRHRNMKNNK